MTGRPPTELELHAYMDGELEPTRRKEIARALQADSGLAATLAAYAADGERLRRALSAAATLPLEPAWIEAVHRGMKPQPRSWPSRRSALVTGLAAAACAAGVLVHLQPSTNDILASAERVRVASGATAAVTLVGPQHDALLQARTGLQVRAPDLDHFGFRLAALQLFGRTGSGAAQLSYLDRQHRLLTIYVRPSNGHVRFDLTRKGSLRVCVWQDDVVGAVIMAPMRAGEMLRIASSAYADLNL